MRIILGLALILLGLSVVPAFAHPDPPPPEGCHICYEDCEEWGLPKGDWHCHESSLKPMPTGEPKRYDPTMSVT